MDLFFIGQSVKVKADTQGNEFKFYFRPICVIITKLLYLRHCSPLICKVDFIDQDKILTICKYPENNLILIQSGESADLPKLAGRNSRKASFR